MAEDAGKKKFIRDFLQRIKPGDGFYDDMRIERFVRPPGTTGEGSTAQSLSGKTINNITELLEDDLRHSFDEGYFTFRLVNAQLGSGKTALLNYLEELAKTKPTYENFSVVRFFRLSDLLSITGHSFNIKFYCYILAQTFWELLNNPNHSVEYTAKSILNDYLGSNEVNQLVAVKKREPFCSKLGNYFLNSGVVFEKFFFEVINEVSKVEPRFTFAYLIDDLDHLKDFPVEFQETKSLIKSMVRTAYQKFYSKVRLLIYIAGTSENILKFLSDDPVVESLVGRWIIVLNKGYGNEFENIRAKIDGRIEGAFKGYKNFDKAWHEIKSILINPDQNLRAFYQYYATELLKIYEKYFKEEPEKRFEGNARELVEAQCRQKWEKYLKQKSYSLYSASTTAENTGHAFDCYVELFHNKSRVARCFGEAKNYDLLSSHLETFDQWLKDVKFNPFTTDKNPPDLAFMIAPDCPPLLQRKLELKNIGFIKSPKNTKSDRNSNPQPEPVIEPIVKNPKNSVNINTAEKEVIIKAFRGTGIRGTTVDKLMNYRENKQYRDIGELASDLWLTVNQKEKLQKKLDKGEICFSSE